MTSLIFSNAIDYFTTIYIVLVAVKQSTVEYIPIYIYTCIY